MLTLPLLIRTMDVLLQSLEIAKKRSGGQLMSLDAITAVDSAIDNDKEGEVCVCHVRLQNKVRT